MGKNKTRATSASVDEFLDAITNDRRRSDAQELVALMAKATGVEATRWGSSIVGFGCHHYVYESGREGDTVAVGFAARAQALVIYGLGSSDDSEGDAKEFSELGVFTRAKGCVYIKRLAEVDEAVLERLIKGAYSARHNR